MTRDRMIQKIIEKRFPFYTSRFRALTHEAHRNQTDTVTADQRMIDTLWLEFSNELYLYQSNIHSDNVDNRISSALSELSANNRFEILDYINKAQDEFEELCGLEKSIIHGIYTTECQEEILQKKLESDRRAHAADLQAFFYLPDSEVEMTDWLGLPSWTAEEATALSLGKNPTKVNAASIADYRNLRGSLFKPQFESRLDFIKRAIATGKLREFTTPDSYQKFFTEVGWNGLRDISHNSSVEYTTRLSSIHTKTDETTRRLRKMYSLIIGMAQIGFKLDINAGSVVRSSDFIKDLKKQLATKMINIDAETLEKIFTAAVTWARESEHPTIVKAAKDKARAELDALARKKRNSSPR